MMVRLVAFTQYRFSTAKSAHELFEFLLEDDSLLKPVKYGISERAKSPFDPKDLESPAELLSGEPEAAGGVIFLKGSKYKAQAQIGWNDSGISDWYLEIDDSFFLSEQDGAVRFVRFVARLFSRFPPIFCGAAPEEDWLAKHWLVERTDLGEVHTKNGLEISHCLPGIYWITVMGPTLVNHFGKTHLKQLPVYNSLDLDREGLLFVLRKGPYTAGLQQRLEQDRQIASQLGDQFFFDIHNPAKRCETISGVTSAQSSPEAMEKDDQKAEPRQFSALQDQIVLSPDGTPYEDPEELAEATVVYFHNDIAEVFAYSLSSLRALDRYFKLHPPRYGFKQDFLERDLIPALGAYFGKVLVRELGGRWSIRHPIMKSTLVKGKEEVNPFRDAYAAVREGKHFVDAYKSFQRA